MSLVMRRPSLDMLESAAGLLARGLPSPIMGKSISAGGEGGNCICEIIVGARFAMCSFSRDDGTLSVGLYLCEVASIDCIELGISIVKPGQTFRFA